MNHPTLAVFLTNYNHAQYLNQTLTDIVQQSYIPKEIIVIDDGSTDNSIEIIESFLQRYPMIRLIKFKQNQGIAYAVSHALSLITSDYVCGCSADDRILPGFFEKSMALLTKYPNAGLCFSPPSFFVTAGESIYDPYWKRGDKAGYFSPAEFADITNGRFIHGISTIYKRSAFIEAGNYIPGVDWMADGFAAIIISFRHGVCYIPEYLTAFRLRSDSYSAVGVQNWERQKKIMAQILEILHSSAYIDVLPFFQRGKLLPFMGIDMLSEILSAPKYSNHIRGFV